ncbi:MAG: DUF5103 domain-containing protein [Muribaculaceae bacterium]|nr:DUF5103 domain-containing protein [Muribaculaceae bacterium]
MKKTALIILMSLVALLSVNAQQQDTQTKIINPNFKTLRLGLQSNEFFPPILNLDGDDRLKVEFDELSNDMRYMRYRLVHCNSDWQPSDLVESEYLDGFNYANIDDFGYSAGTFANYVHYQFYLPNDNMTMTKSGNYLIQVYPEDNPEDVLLQARFMVSENLTSVYSTITSRTDIDYNRENQQLTVKVSTRSNNIQDWYNDLKLIVTQNSREDNQVVLSRPMLIEQGGAVYEHNRQLIFQASNEFRRFEVVATNYPGMNVANIQYFNPYYHVTLYTDKNRREEPYLFDQTQYGRYKIRQSGVNDSEVNADYVIVHFSLETPQMYNGRLYIDGDFTHHIYSDDTAMRYNPATGLYELDMMLKMGSYNYQYVWLPNGSNAGTTATVEGNHYQTVNEYLARAYYRRPGDRYDRLIGYGIIYSGR